MRINTIAVAHLLAATAGFGVAAAAAAAALPPNHPPLAANGNADANANADLLADFAGELGCPHASEWLTKGPERAARDLLDARRRQLGGGRGERRRARRGRRRGAEEGTAVVAGSCAFSNSWTGGAEDCVEMRGASWTEESMRTRCDGTDGTLTLSTGCILPEAMGGWCTVANDAGGVEASPLDAATAGCDMLVTVCESFMGGTFEAGDACGDGNDEGDGGSDAGESEQGGGDNSGTLSFGGGGDASVGGSAGASSQCAIAPGPIGAAHQAGRSGGYLSSCPGTPAEGSPYMWPLRWTADSESRYMAFGSDDVVYRSRGRVYYRLDRNWKRQDTHFQEGVLRTIGQLPCEEENRVSEEEGVPNACDRDKDGLTTMLHRGGKMVFVYWKNGTLPDQTDDVSNIASCSWIDMKIVGNIRPDWFMDDRGDDTDVQYLGNQHVFHADMEARLVKQWRKKDFADQYFVMSMGGNPKPEEGGVHWPLVLNIPGEGFGDDALRIYKNHAPLADDGSDDGLFLLDELYEKAGGTCAPRNAGGPNDGEGGEGVGGGPPVLEEPIPSNLVVDPNSWHSNVYTYSPVWRPPAGDDASSSSASSSSSPSAGDNVFVTRAGESAAVASCYDAAEGAVRLTATFSDVALDDGSLPWIGLAFRDAEECLMTPRGGGDGEFVYVHRDETDGDGGGGGLTVEYGPLPASAKGFGSSSADDIAGGLAPINDADGFSDGAARVLDDGSSVELTFRRRAASSTGPADDAAGAAASQVSRSGAASPPEAMRLTYAVGSSPELGYHETRGCFEVTEFPPCAGAGAGRGEGAEEEEEANDVESGGSETADPGFGNDEAKEQTGERESAGASDEKGTEAAAPSKVRSSSKRIVPSMVAALMASIVAALM